MKTKLHNLLWRSCLIGSAIMISCGGLIALKVNPSNNPPSGSSLPKSQELEINTKNDAIQYLSIENGTVKGFKVGISIPNDFVLTIPSKNGSTKISRIAHNAFENRHEIKEVLIEEGIQQIREQAFSNCTNLETISIPNSIDQIGSHAFSHCHNLSSITIPENVTFIGSKILHDCPKLTSDKVISHSPVLFDWWVNNHYYHDQTLAQMEIINLDEHRNSSNQSFQIIGEGVLSGLKELQSLTISGNVSEIGRFAFSGCPKLTANNITNYSGVLFKLWIDEHNYHDQSLSAMKTVNLANHFNSDHQPFSKISDDAFMGCKNLENIAIPSTITKIGERAFESCKLKRITLPESIYEVGPHVFRGCSLLKSENFVNNSRVLFDWWVKNHQYQKQTLQQMPEIDLSHFTNSSNQPFQVIAQYAFEDCASLQKIVIPESIKQINAHAFGLVNNSLKTIIINSDDLTLDLDAFEGVSRSAQYYVNNHNMATRLHETGINDHQINVACDDWYVKKYDDQCELTMLTNKGRLSEHLIIPAYVNKIDPQLFNDHRGLLKTITIESAHVKFENRFVENLPNDVVFRVSNSTIRDDLIKLGVNKQNVKIKRNWHIGAIIGISVGTVGIAALIISIAALCWRRYQHQKLAY